ncbi:MAG TPA: PBP1A family penicillin-binding protein [Candidatus Onthousia excrementipullorum]|uniref:PBP1A family penicillin-binding protein n=1 Tax=Candidatus Onthousia excrementipullorum TaxID=2840884 RepID=A0A9D1J3G3_9FIRM|nr:PBP1A family penicillin-binding protein [Candidatus Onthousia excrementipullorum]
MKVLKKCLKIFIILIGLFILGNIGVYTYAKLSPKIEIKNANSFMLFDSDNEVFFQGSGSREWISLDDISPYLIEATINTEDKNFYKHIGFDYLRILKAMVVNITSGTTSQGASTITQQYAKNLFLDFDKTWKRKWDEMWYTIEIESHYSKDEILEGYLNTINYGHGKYGIETASKYYFGKSAKDLTLAEAAMLTGIPKSPSNYSPFVNLKKATQRQQMILKSMYDDGVISEAEYNKALDEELKFVGEEEEDELESVMYYQDAVIEELKSLKEIPESFLETGGLKVYTSLDMEAQKQLEETVKNTMPDSDLETASVMVNPNNGRVIALVGGKDYSKSEFNRATDAKRQVGSTMKAFLYYAALENGFTASTTFTSEETTFTFNNNQSYSPQNYNGTYGNKPISMATAIAYSENIYAVKTHMFLGEDTLIDMAKRLGITSKLDEVPSLALGTSEIGMLEMAGAYSAFANEGYKVTPHFITKVVDKEGNVLYEADEEKDLILNSSLTFILSNLLTATYDANFIDYNYPTAVNLASRMTHKYALKSGTTNTDNWYIGYNKDIVTAVWCGYDDARDLKSSEYKYAQNIWLNTMEGYMKDKDDEWYKQPDNVVGVLVNPITGKPATDSDEKKIIEYYVKGTEPSVDDPVFDEISGNTSSN